MRVYHRAVWIVVAAIGCPLSGAMAGESGSGPYIGMRGGVAMLDKASLTADARSGLPPLDTEVTFDPGFSVSGVGGYAFAGGLRVEGELGYRIFRQTALDLDAPGDALAEAATSLPFLSPATQEAIANVAREGLPLEGHNTGVSLMVNGWYDIDLGLTVTPYLGGGVGMTFISVKESSPTTGLDVIDDHDTVFAAQVGGGIAYDVPILDGHRVTISVDYRYFDPVDPRLDGTLGGLVSTTATAERRGHAIGVGIRVGF